MSIRAVLSCNGTEGIFACRQAIPVGEVLTASEARRIAAKDGWTVRVHTGGVLVVSTVQDFCPSCTRKNLAHA